MKKEEVDVLQDHVPEIYCAICIWFEEKVNTVPIINRLKQIGMEDIKITRPKCESGVGIDIAQVKYERFWYLDEALTKMFFLVDNCLSEIKDIADKYKGKIIIDVAFYQYATYPALTFEGENMKKIRYLEADISIDPYDFSDTE